jgi:hypothetical protein
LSQGANDGQTVARNTTHTNKITRLCERTKISIGIGKQTLRLHAIKLVAVFPCN